jgi:hypothetical protein
VAAHEVESAEPEPATAAEPAPAPERQDAPVLTVRPMAAEPTLPEQNTAPIEFAPAAEQQEPAQEASAEAPKNARPHREDVQRTLGSLRPQLVGCAAGKHGVVDATVTIAANGRVNYSLIRGAFVGTPEGSCMARALREATFPPFSGPNFKVMFPYSL